MQYFVPSQNAELQITDAGASVWRSGTRVAGPIPVQDALEGLGLRRNTQLPVVPTVSEIAQWGRAVLGTLRKVPSAQRKNVPSSLPSVFTYQPKPRKDKPLPLEVGFDLGAREQEVRNILFKLFKYKLERGGFDHEDAVQEVMLALAIRNRGRCPWDAKKSSWGHYVYMVIDGTLCNMARRAGRRSVEIPDGLIGRDDEVSSRQDIQTSKNYRDPTNMTVISRLASDAVDSRLFTLLSEGVSTRDAASHLGLSNAQVSDRLARVRNLLS